MSARALDWLLDRMLPEPCAACFGPLHAPGRLLCPGCAASAPIARPKRIDGVAALAPFRYAEPIQSVIHRYKYEAQPELARRLAAAIALGTNLAEWLEPNEPVCFVPVPVHPERLASRGYNQSGLLATRLARQLGGRLELRALARRSNTRQQVALSRAEREQNLRDQIAARGPLAGPVVLVDDVLTSGATARACFAALRRAGAEPRALLTIAIADQVSEFP